jgi:hypothetical protein
MLLVPTVVEWVVSPGSTSIVSSGTRSFLIDFEPVAFSWPFATVVAFERGLSDFGPGFAITVSTTTSSLSSAESRRVTGARFEEGFSWGTLLGPGELAFVFLRG